MAFELKGKKTLAFGSLREECLKKEEPMGKDVGLRTRSNLVKMESMEKLRLGGQSW